MPFTAELFGIILAFVAFGCVNSDCPNPEKLPVWYEKDQAFLCATRFTGKPSNTYGDGCHMCSTDKNQNPLGIFIKDGESKTMDCKGCYIPMGSLVVKPGCQLTAYKESGFSGPAKEYGHGTYWDAEGPISAPHCGNGWKSYRCKCVQKPVTCQPSDAWKTIQLCDNTKGSSTVICKANSTTGTIYEHSIRDGFAVSPEVEAALRANLWNRFRTVLGVSPVTGYDWGDSGGELDFDDEHKSGVSSFSVAPGCVGQLSQVFGYCGKSVTKTVSEEASERCGKGIRKEPAVTTTDNNRIP